MTGIRLKTIYRLLFDHFGPRHWWPADTPFEVAVGAILTQNTNWRNVEAAIANLRWAGALGAEALCRLPVERLEELVRPSGFFRQKAARLHDLSCHLVERYAGDLTAMLAGPLDRVRDRLLERPGIGPETADSILLYAGGHPSFVIDAYTRRLFARLGWFENQPAYAELRRRIMQALPPEAELYKEYHALIVEHCKVYCRKQSPLCASCPLLSVCPTGKRNSA